MSNSDPKAYGASWYAATAAASPERPKLAAETDVDVCVIGGGLAGLTVAREVARRGWSVLLLEQQRIAWNASGRNSGVVTSGFAVSAEALVGRVGLDYARRLWALSEGGVEYVRAAAREMPSAALNEGGWLHVSKTDRSGAMAARFNLLNGEFGVPVESWPAERVREELRSPLYFDALHYPQGLSVHPFNYALGLAAAAEAAGARICEDTTALHIDPVGVRKRVDTKETRIRAAHVVLAGNVHLGGLMPQVATTLLPVNSYAIATAPLGPQLREVIRYRGAVTDTELADNHYRVVDGDRLLWAGGSTVWHGSPKRYAGALLRDLGKTYRQLKGAKAEYFWSGTLGQTVHGMPQIGEISPGLWLLSGFGRQGLNTTAMGGELLARAIVEGDQGWQLFTPFGLVWAGGAFGRATRQFFYWTARSRERLGSRVARGRNRKLGAPAAAGGTPAAAGGSPAAPASDSPAAS